MLNQMGWISLQPVGAKVSEAYEQSTTVVSTISMMYAVIFVIFTFPCCYLNDKYGCRAGVLLGSALTALGMFIKCFINHQFYIVIIG